MPLVHQQRTKEAAIRLMRQWYGKYESMWTRGRGARINGLVAARRLDFVRSQPDATLRKNGWRHDITKAGRTALLRSLSNGERDG